MAVLKPTTPAGRDRVARLLEPVILELRESEAPAADFYVVLATTVGVLRRGLLARGARAAIEELDVLVDQELERWAAGRWLSG